MDYLVELPKKSQTLRVDLQSTKEVKIFEPDSPVSLSEVQYRDTRIQRLLDKGLLVISGVRPTEMAAPLVTEEERAALMDEEDKPSFKERVFGKKKDKNEEDSQVADPAQAEPAGPEKLEEELN